MDATDAIPTSVRFGHGLVTLVLFGALLFGALTVVSVGVGMIRDGDSILYGDTFGVPAELSPESLESAVPKGVELTGQTPVQVTVHDPTVRQMFLRHAADFGAVILTIVVAWLLRGLTRSVVRREPFGERNVARLRTLGRVLLLGVPLVAMINSALLSELSSSLPPVEGGDLGTVGLALPGSAIFAALAAYILAEVFAQGLKLREDVEATI